MNTNMQAVSYGELNWNQLWLEARLRAKRVEKNKAHWNMRASSFAGHTSQSGSVARFIRYLQPDSAWTVLDVGCGPGTLAIPLAARVRSVTAIDISERMIGILEAACCDKHICNIKAGVVAWEDDWHRAGLKKHDVAIASRSLVMENLEVAITKLAAMAKKRVVISSLVGDGPYDRKIFAAIGRELDRGPDFICI
jgi:SAM-dependent methyltransferase